MANLRDLAPGVGSTLSTLVPGVVAQPTADSLRVAPATDPAPAMRSMERDSSSQAGLAYKSSRLLGDANYLANEEAVRRAAGDIAGADTLRGQITGLQQEAAFWAPKEQDITKIGMEPGRLLDYGAGAVGSIAASMQDPLLIGAGLRAATGLAGLSKNPLAQAVNKGGNAITAAGVFAPNFMANAGETYNEQANDAALVANRTPMERALAAGGAGVAMGALDALPQMGMLGRAVGPANAVNKAIGPGSILAKAGRDSVLEGATEVAQTGLQKGIHTLMNGERDTSGDMADYANAFAQGTLGSAPLNTATNTIEAMRDRVAEPGDPGVKKGDDVDLKTGKKITPDFETDLKQRSTPEWQKSKASIGERMDLMEGTQPDDFDQANAPAWNLKRRDAIAEELDKAGDDKSKEYAATLRGMDFSDPIASLEHEDVMTEAFDHVRPLAGLDDESVNRLIAAADKRGKRMKSERLFAPQDHIELKGDDQTRSVNTATLVESLVPNDERSAPQKKELGTFLKGIGREMTAMGKVAAGKDYKPTEGELNRAARLGTIVGSMLQQNTESGVAQIAEAAGVPAGPLFEAFAARAKESSQKTSGAVRESQATARTSMADKMLKLVPPARIQLMQKAGINPFEPAVKTHLLEGIVAMLDGDESMLPREKAELMFGKDALDSMEDLIGSGNTWANRLNTDAMGFTGSHKNIALSSDDATDEATDFDKAQAEKSAAKAPSDSIIYGRGSQGKGMPIADMLKGKGKDNKLPSFIDTRHPLAQKERDKLMDEYEATAGTGPKTNARIAPVSELMGDMPQAQREGLMLRAIEEDYKGKGGNVLTADDRRREDPVYLAKAEASGTAKGLRAMKEVDRVLSEMYANWRPRSVKAVNDALQENAERMPEAVYQAAVQAMQSPDRKAAVRVVHQQIRSAIEADTTKLKQAVSTAAGTEWTEGGDPSLDYFKNKEVLVVEKADATADKDRDVMTQQEFKGLIAKGKKATDAARKLDNEDAANEMLWKEGMLQFPATEDGGEGVSIKAKDIVAWVRAAEFATTTMTDSAKRKAAAQNKQENFLSLLAQGMAEMLRQGYITGLPVVIDAQGNAEAFAQPRSRKDINADRRAELAANGPDEARAINRKFDAEARLGGMPASLMLDDGRTAAQFVMSPKFDTAVEMNEDPLLGSAYAAARDGDGDAERVAKSIAAARQRATEREAALRDARNKVADKVSREQAAADKFLSRNDEVAPIDGDGFYFGDPSEDGTEADKDAQETAVRDNAIQNATTFANVKYGRNNAVTKAKQVGEQLWQQWVMTPAQGLARIKAIAKDLSDARNWHAAPLAALVAEARARSEKLAPSDKSMMQSLVSKTAGVVLRTMDTSSERTKIVSDLAGTTFDNPGAENTWLAKAARHYAEVEAKRLLNAEQKKEAARAAAAEPAPRATPGKTMLSALKATINERKAQRLEAELSVAQEKLEATLREVAPMAAKIKAVDNLVSRINLSLDEKLPFPGLFVQRGQLERLLAEARSGLAAAGRDAMREHKADMERLAQVASEVARGTRELGAMEKRNPTPTVAMGRTDSLGADGVPKIPGDKGPKTTPSQRKAERVAAKAEPTTAAPTGQGFKIVQLPFGASKSGVFDGHRAGSKNVTNAAPGAPGALGNPFVARDVRGTTSRKEAVAKFKEAFLKRVNSDTEYRDWVLTLRGKAVGYYKPDEADIHLHVVQEWLAQQSDAPAADRKMVTREDAIQKRQDYLDNPPADYTTEKARSILAWAKAGMARAEARKAELQGEAREVAADNIAALKRLVTKAESVLEGDDSLADFEGTAQKLSNRDFGAQKPVKGGDAPAPSDADLNAVQAVIRKLLGPQITVAFEKAFDAAGEWVEADKTVRIAMAGLQPMLSTAYHEGLHGFFSQVLGKNDTVKQMLYRAVNDPKVDRQLRSLLAGETAALAALDASPEEKVAYTFELWATGLLDLPAPDAKGFFGRVRRFFRSVMGLVNDQDRALEIFTALYDGKMAEPSAAQRAVQKAMERGEGMAATRLKRDREVEFFRSTIFSAGKILRDSESETAKTVAKMFFTNPGSTKGGTEPGYLNLRRNKTNQSMNHLRQILDGLSPAELKHLSKLDNQKTDPSTLPDGPVKTALQNLYKFNARFYGYLTQAGLDVGIRDDGRYTPMVWSMQYMIENKDKFVAMLVKEYPSVLTAARAKALVVDPEATTLEDVAGMMHQAIVDRTGVDTKLDAQREDGVLSPFFASENGRSFDWIAAEHRAEFLSEDIVEKMTAYIHQGVRAAEYTRAFGEAGEDLGQMLRRKGDTIGMTANGPQTADEDGPIMEELREAAVKAKVPEKDVEAWVQRRHEDIRRSVGAMEGVLGKDITDRMRQLNSGAMVYQNLRLLPLSIFAAMLDPNGIMVSGGTLNDGLKAYVRGMKKVFNTWKALATGGDIGLDGDEDERAAIIVGSVDSTVFLERMGEARTSEYIGGTARKVNNKFFLANGLTMWDRSMRIAATAAGMRFIKRHAAGENPEHSARWLKDLGLTADDVVLGADGRVVLDRNQLARMRAESTAGWGGMTDAQKAEHVLNMLPKATKDVAKMHAAVNRFVERSILSPNAAQRPAWSSDPHYAALFHLKQYTYSFHETIMQHVAEEAGHGNYRAGLQMLMGVPIMIAADITKGLVTGGGSLPGYMANWNMGDWLMHGWTRAGLNGIGQIGADAWGDPSSMFGPSVDQVVDTALSPAEKFGNLDMVPGVRYLRPELDKVIGG